MRGYAPEPGLRPDTLVLCASYSGSTEETLACFEAAGAAGAPRVALTTGGPLAERAREEGVPVIGVPSGMQPRAAVVYMTVAALECAAAAGPLPPLQDEIEGARRCSPSLADDPEPAGVAEALHDTIPVVHGAELTAPVARRWKTQLNENAKVGRVRQRAAGGQPQRDRGLGVGGREHDPARRRVPRGPGAHERIERRIELYRGADRACGRPGGPRGGPRRDRGGARALPGDARRPGRACDLAELAGVEPTPVEAIEGFKRSL